MSPRLRPAVPAARPAPVAAAIPDGSRLVSAPVSAGAPVSAPVSAGALVSAPVSAGAPARTAPPAGKPRRSWATGWPRWLPPALAYVVANLWYCLVAARYGYDWLTVGSRLRWDSGHYLSIASTGYQLMPCAEATERGWADTDWCGNAGWFPLYPYATRGLAAVTTLPLEATAVLIAELAVAGLLVTFWHLLGARITARNLACLAVVTWLPAGVYLHAAFPMSLAVLLALVTFLLLTRGHWVVAGVTGALTAMTYPIAVLLAPAVVCFLLFTPGTPIRSRILRAGYVGGLTAAGTLAVFTLLHATTGRFTAYLLLQARYGHGTNNPVSSFARLSDSSQPIISIQGPPDIIERVRASASGELLFSALLVALVLITVVAAAVQRRATALDWSLALYGGLLLVVPLIVGVNVAQYRSHTLLLPIVFVLRLLPAWAVGQLAAVAAILVPALTWFFLAGYLI